MDVIDSSALCLAKFPAPLMLNYSLGSQALSLPNEGGGPTILFGSLYPPTACPFCPSSPSCMLFLSRTHTNVPSLPWEPN